MERNMQFQHQSSSQSTSKNTQEDNFVVFAIIVALIAILCPIFIYIYNFTKRKIKTSNIVLLVGPSGSGKTKIFTRLVYDTEKKTVTSMKENQANIDLLGIKLIDVPGSDRLRYRLWEQYRNKVGHVVFVLDSTTFNDSITEIGDCLYSILKYPPIHKNKVKITIACNKVDLPNASKSRDVCPLLEKELNDIRKTKSGELGKTSNLEEDDYFNLHNIDFKHMGVTFLETNIDNLDNLARRISFE